MPVIRTKTTGMAMTTIQAPWVNLVTSTMTSTRAVSDRAEALIASGTGASCRRPAVARVRAQQLGPVPHHAGLAEGERDEHPDDVQLDQPGGAGVERPDQQRRRAAARMTMPLREDEPVAAPGELARQEAVLAQDRGEDREAVERGVRGQHQDRRGERLHREEPDRVCPKTAPASWAMTVRWLVAGRGADQRGRGLRRRARALTRASAVMPANMAIVRPPMIASVGGGVAALGLLEVGHAVADRLDPGQRGAARRRTPAARAPTQQQPADVAARRVIADRRRLGDRGVARATSGRSPTREHREDARRRSRRSGSRRRVPDSLTPRRFISASTAPAPGDSATACGASDGTAETMLATPAATDTATVST